ncbi:MAG TPA: hypothetical protein VG942_12565 [Hyphomonadaceae bacterium]|nr:hypothetical protein [Hyphomonadaceae bacterium]
MADETETGAVMAAGPMVPGALLVFPPGVLMFASIYSAAFYVWGGVLAAMYDPD